MEIWKAPDDRAAPVTLSIIDVHLEVHVVEKSIPITINRGYTPAAVKVPLRPKLRPARPANPRLYVRKVLSTTVYRSAGSPVSDVPGLSN